MLETAKMKTENEKLEKKARTAQNKDVAPAEKTSAENFSSELSEQIWSVVNFESVVASSLTYDEATEKLKQLAEKKISGLCIITDEAAERV